MASPRPAPSATGRPRPFGPGSRFDWRRYFRWERLPEATVELGHRRIYTLPNQRGMGLAALLLIQWLTAINYNSNLGFILTFLLVAVALLAMLHGYRNLAGLRIHARPLQPVFAGEHAALELMIANPTPLARYSLWLKAAGAEPLRFDVGADESATPVLGLKTERRGWLDPGTVTLYTEFPLGILYAWAPMRFNAKGLVYPRPAADPLPFPPAFGYGKLGRERHAAEEFSGFQTYQAGDSLRRIHWKAVAKGLDPQVKRYTGEQADDLEFSLDEAPGGDLEARLSRLCRWVVDAEAAGLRYALTLPGARILPDRGPPHARRCLEALARFGLGD